MILVMFFLFCMFLDQDIAEGTRQKMRSLSRHLDLVNKGFIIGLNCFTLLTLIKGAQVTGNPKRSR